MRKNERLSERQQNILRFMDRYVAANGFPPTIREIGEATEINSTSVVNYNLNKLVKLGYLLRTATKSRGLRLVKPGMNDRPVKAGAALTVELRGLIVAGDPVESFTDTNEDPVEVVPSMLGGYDPSEVFAVRVKGDSMIDAMIQDGDVVILKRVDTAKNGDMVAIWLESTGETTLKYLFHEEGGRIRLQPAHPTMEPRYVNARECRVQGRLLSVIRVVK